VENLYNKASMKNSEVFRKVHIIRVRKSSFVKVIISLLVQLYVHSVLMPNVQVPSCVCLTIYYLWPV